LDYAGLMAEERPSRRRLSSASGGDAIKGGTAEGERPGIQTVEVAHLPTTLIPRAPIDPATADPSATADFSDESSLVVEDQTVETEQEPRPSPNDAAVTCLVVIHGGEIGKRYDLADRVMSIGRGSECDVRIEHSTVSRTHAQLVPIEGGHREVRDLDSTNGTFVNNERVDSRVLRDGDLLMLGSSILKCLSGDNVEGAYHREIYRQSTVDPLTQIHNRRYFMEALRKEISRARRYTRPLSVAIIDVDHFKLVNDLHGHLVGDHVLRDLAAAIGNRIRQEDVFARFGGEEFMLLLPETNLANAVACGEKIRRIIEEHAFVAERRIPITVSIGVAELVRKESLTHLIRRADDMLYAAKREGRNRVRG
jgi:diguanylate cyclase (GGDEF)-like protein